MTDARQQQLAEYQQLYITHREECMICNDAVHASDLCLQGYEFWETWANLRGPIFGEESDA